MRTAGSNNPLTHCHNPAEENTYNRLLLLFILNQMMCYLTVTVMLVHITLLLLYYHTVTITINPHYPTFTKPHTTVPFLTLLIHSIMTSWVLKPTSHILSCL